MEHQDSAQRQGTGEQRGHGEAVAVLTLGFATAVAMWLVGFLTHLPGLRAEPIVVGVLLLVTQGLGGVAAGILVDRARAARVGAMSGAVAGLINLLLVFSVLAGDDPTAGLRPGWPLVLLGVVASSAVVGGACAALSSRLARRPSAQRDARGWAARFAIVAALSVAPVLFSGGLVTSAEAGLAVPDWPNSYSANMFLYPLSKMTGGIYYEHAHRLFGALAGLTTLALVFVMQAAWPSSLDKGRLMRRASLAVFALVAVQGVLGGVRVVAAEDGEVPWREAAPTPAAIEGEVPKDFALTRDTAASRSYAVAHGVLGQLTFASLCALAVAAQRRRHDHAPRSSATSKWASAALATLGLQLALGAVARHFESAHALITHIGFALIAFGVVTIAAMMAVGPSSGERTRDRLLRALGGWTLAVLLAQVVLGFVALAFVLPYGGTGQATPAALLSATAHQATGAALLGLIAAVAARSGTLRAPRARSAEPAVGTAAIA